jgi:MFS family permease
MTDTEKHQEASVKGASSSGTLRALFANRNYTLYTMANGISLVGLWIQRLAVGWLAWQLTNSALWLGVIAFADLCPTLVVGPFAGALADRHSRLRVAWVTQVMAFAQAVTLCVMTWTGAITIWWLLLLTFLLGVFHGAGQPARLALVASLVHRENLGTAIAFNSVVFNSARFAGPALAGVVITTMGIAPAFLMNALSFLGLVVVLPRLKLPQATPKKRPESSLLADVAEGFRYCFGNASIGPLLLMMMAASVLAAPVAELLPAFADEVFGRGAAGLAWLTSATGIGAAIGGIWLTQRRSLVGLTTIAFASLLVLGGSLLVFAATSNFWVAVAAMTVMGLGRLLSGVGVQTLIQTAVEEQMRARVMSLYGVLFRSGPALGALAMGGLSGALGLRWPVVMGATLCIAVWLLMRRQRRQMVLLLEAPET